jgi:hypothetical protein
MWPLILGGAAAVWVVSRLMKNHEAAAPQAPSVNVGDKVMVATSALTPALLKAIDDSSGKTIAGILPPPRMIVKVYGVNGNNVYAKVFMQGSGLVKSGQDLLWEGTDVSFARNDVQDVEL